MREQNKKIKQNSTCDEKKGDESFFICELNERTKIKQKSEVFKYMVDTKMAKELNRIESDSKSRENIISTDVSALMSALNCDDSEQIKAALNQLNDLIHK